MFRVQGGRGARSRELEVGWADPLALQPSGPLFSCSVQRNFYDSRFPIPDPLTD